MKRQRGRAGGSSTVQHSPRSRLRPPIIDSEYNLPVRFPALWGASRRPVDATAALVRRRSDRHRDSRRDGDDLARRLHRLLWPERLWEALYATLWRAVCQDHPAWARRYRRALVGQALTPATHSARPDEDLIEQLSRLKIPKDVGGRPGSGHALEVMPEFYRELRHLLQRAKPPRRPYAPGTLGRVRALVRTWQEFVTGFPALPASVADPLTGRPVKLAQAITGTMFRLKPETVRRYVERNGDVGRGLLAHLRREWLRAYQPGRARPLFDLADPRSFLLQLLEDGDTLDRDSRTP